MLIINAVECNTSSKIDGVVIQYLKNSPNSTILTDSEHLYDYMSDNYPSTQCIYDESLMSLWLQKVEDSLLIITRIENFISEIYNDLRDNNVVISIDSVDELIEGD